MKVKNDSDEVFKDRFDGVCYSIEPSGITDIPVDAFTLWNTPGRSGGGAVFGLSIVEEAPQEPQEETVEESIEIAPKVRKSKKRSGGR